MTPMSPVPEVLEDEILDAKDTKVRSYVIHSDDGTPDRKADEASSLIPVIVSSPRG